MQGYVNWLGPASQGCFHYAISPDREGFHIVNHFVFGGGHDPPDYPWNFAGTRPGFGARVDVGGGCVERGFDILDFQLVGRFPGLGSLLQELVVVGFGQILFLVLDALEDRESIIGVINGLLHAVVEVTNGQTEKRNDNCGDY